MYINMHIYFWYCRSYLLADMGLSSLQTADKEPSVYQQLLQANIAPAKVRLK